MKLKVLLVDGLNLVRRIFEARGGIAGDEFVQASLQSLQRAVSDHNPGYGVVVWDSQEPTWRHLLDDSYKANRSPTPGALLAAIPQLDAAFLGIGIKSLTIANYEADDVIATLATGIAANDGQAVVLSTDKMFFQLFGPGIDVYNHFDRVLASEATIAAKYGLNSHRLVDYWSLSGDNSNNIKGVKGVGKKTASTLLAEHGNLETLIQKGDVKQLVGNEEQARKCKQLVELKRDVTLGINLKDFRISA